MKNETVYQSLLSMGFDQDQANRASAKFDDPELAINWVLEGAVDDPTPPVENITNQPQPLRSAPYNPPTTPHPHAQAQAQAHHGRSNTPYPDDPPPPRTPSPTVSDLDGGGNGARGFVDLQRGLTEDEALAEAIRISTEESTSTSSVSKSYSHAHNDGYAQTKPGDGQPGKPSSRPTYNPPSGPPPLPPSRPVLQLRPPPPPPPPSAGSSARARPPPPPPPPSTSSTSTTSANRPPDRRQTRSPTPGPPELGSQQRGLSGGPTGIVAGSKNPFLSAMRPLDAFRSDSGSTATPTDLATSTRTNEHEVEGSGGRGESMMRVGSDRNVRFGGEDIVPPDLLPPWLKGAGSMAPGAGAGAGRRGTTGPSQTGSDDQAGAASLQKVSDEVEDQDGSRGMVLVPLSERLGSDSMAVDGPARSSQVDGRHPTTAGSAGGAFGSPPSPPPMDTYPIDKDEEQLALERAIKLSLSTTTASTNNTHIPPSGANKDRDENTVEGVVTSAAEYDMVVDDETTRLAMTQVEDWRRDEDDTDFNVIRESGAEPGRPLAVRSRTENTVWSAHVVQALISIPAIRRAIDGIDPDNLDPALFGEHIHRDVIDFLKQLVDKHDKRDISETLVTAKLDHFGLRSGPIAIGERAYEMMKLFAPSLDQLPTVPIVAAKETLEPETIDVGMSSQDTVVKTESGSEAAVIVKEEEPNAMDQESENVVVAEPLRRLFTSEMRRRDDPTQGPTYDFCWMIPHDPRTDKTISDAISNAQKTWRPDHLFSSLSQVFCLGMTKADQTPGGEALVGLEESLYLDRFMIGNADKVDTLTVRQTELRASIETRKKEVENLVKHKGQDIDKMIERTIRYFDETYEMEGSPEATTVVKNATITQLRAVKSQLEEKRAVLSTALEAEEIELQGLWDEPELKLNKYNLQAVCFNSGWSGMNAIRSYIKGDGEQWWRVQESVMEKVTFHDVATDNWGMMFDQGPYFLIYTRDSDNDDAEHLGVKVPKVDDKVVEPLDEDEQGTKDIKPFEGDEVLVDVGTNGSGGEVEDDLKVYM